MKLWLPVAGFALIVASYVPAAGAASEPASVRHAPAGEHMVVGTIRSMQGLRLWIVNRNGRTLVVDDADAWRLHQSAVPVVGRSISVRGTYEGTGVLHAQTVLRVKDSPALWPADR
jgi:hypothetical protein